MKIGVCVIALALWFGFGQVAAAHRDETDKATTNETLSGTALNASLNLPFYARLQTLSQASALSPLDIAYIDAWTALRDDSPCSRFYGGSDEARYVLNALVEQLRVKDLHNGRRGMTMFGNYLIVHSHQPSIRFRLFPHAYINQWGLFFHAVDWKTRLALPRVDRYAPNSREARALMLLHELAHLIIGANGAWLIPDDGRNEDLSVANTRLVAARCRPQLDGLHRTKPRAALLQQLVATL